jgi:hypothetical protein
MILVDGLIVQWVAVSVAVSLLIKHIDHVAAAWRTTEPGAELGTRKITASIGMPQRHPGPSWHCSIRRFAPNARTSACAFLPRVGAVACTRSTQPSFSTRVECRRRGGQPRRAVLGMISAHLCVVTIASQHKLRPSRARGTRPSRQLRRPPIRLATPVADRRAPQRRAECRGRGPTRRILAHARPAAAASTRVASGFATSRLTPVRSSRRRRPVAP